MSCKGLIFVIVPRERTESPWSQDALQIIQDALQSIRFEGRKQTKKKICRTCDIGTKGKPQKGGMERSYTIGRYKNKQLDAIKTIPCSPTSSYWFGLANV